MKRECDIYEEFLEKEGYAETFPMKDARILFQCKNGQIQDLIVEEFTDENTEKKQYLYQKYSFDVGNCLSDWNEWEFSDVLIKIFISYGVPFEIRKKILFELSKVEEWRPHLAFWIWRNFNDQA